MKPSLSPRWHIFSGNSRCLLLKLLLMLRNYIKIALRNLLKRKDYSILNVIGLAIGIACCLLIFQYVSFEKSYDKFLPNSDRTFRLSLDNYQQGNLDWQSATVHAA